MGFGGRVRKSCGGIFVKVNDWGIRICGCCSGVMDGVDKGSRWIKTISCR